MQKAFKHQACLNVFDGIWKNQLTLPGWLRGALCGESLRERPSSLVPVLRAASGWARGQEEDRLLPMVLMEELSSPWSKKTSGGVGGRAHLQRFLPVLQR